MTASERPRWGGWRERRGVVALEFALVLPMLVLLAAGTIEAGVMLMADASLELAVRNAMRAGGIDESGQRDAVVAARIDSLMDMWKGQDGKITIEAKALTSVENQDRPEPFTDSNGNGVHDSGEQYTDVNDNGVWDSDMGSSAAGGTGDIVVYTVTMTRPGFSGVLQLAGISTLTFVRQMALAND